LSTFLCIDLTSNWYIPITAVNLYFLTNQIVKKLVASHLRAHLLVTSVTPLLSSSFTIVPLSLACCKVVSIVFFAIKKTSYDLLLYHISPEVHLNIRLSVCNYTRHCAFLQ